jgi:site-specific DNA recombinase
VPHRDQLYDGLHEAIIDPKTWAATAEMLSTNGVSRITSRNLASGRPLLGLLVHEDGSRFSPTHATKKGRRYPYYVSRQSGVQVAGSVRRLPAVETEQAVVSTLRHFLSDALRLTKPFPNLRVQQNRLLVSAARHRAELLNDDTSMAAYRLVRDLISSVVGNESGMSVVLCLPKLSLELLPEAVWNGTTEEELLTLPCPFVVKRRGSEVRLVIANDPVEAKPIPSLERVVARARDLAERISSGEFHTMAQLVAYSGTTKQYVRRILRLAALSLRNTDAILNGRHLVDLTVADLCDGLPAYWGGAGGVLTRAYPHNLAARAQLETLGLVALLEPVNVIRSSPSVYPSEATWPSGPGNGRTMTDASRVPLPTTAIPVRIQPRRSHTVHDGPRLAL